MLATEETQFGFEAGLDFILSHVSGPIFPRNISTLASQGRQFTVSSKAAIIQAAAKSDYIDIRINAYPELVGYKGRQQQAPDFLFIDLDRSNFKNQDDHKSALYGTLVIIKDTLEQSAEPSVIWSGNGYHVYLPLNNAVVLENVQELGKFDNPSVKFLRYAEQELSSGKCDPSHRPSFKSCMLRIPGSFNSKCIISGRAPEVCIIQRWNGYRPRLPLQLMKKFHSYLMTERINELQKLRSREKRYYSDGSPGSIGWIEALLQTPIEDYRKNALALIVAPYLLNVKKLSYSDAMAAAKAWLDLCDGARRLDSYFSARVKAALDTAAREKTLPMRLDTLKSRNKGLYERLKTSKK